MLRYTPILLALLYGVGLYLFSAHRTKKHLAEQSVELADPSLLPILQKLAKALDLPRIRVFVYNVPQVNGLAAPDGKIYLTRGFLDKYHSGEISDTELASVIAHEMGHVALGHTRRRLIDFSSQNALRTALAMFLGRILPGIGPFLANAAMSLLMARLSRGDEYEADAYASALLIKAGIGTEPQISLFRKLDRLTGGAGGNSPAWLLSHPKTQARIHAIERNAEKWQG